MKNIQTLSFRFVFGPRHNFLEILLNVLELHKLTLAVMKKQSILNEKLIVKTKRED